MKTYFQTNRYRIKTTRIGKGRQHKAPDHLILNGKIAIERKSRNAIDQSQFYKKLQEIATQQGAPFWGVGRLNFKVIINQLPVTDWIPLRLKIYNPRDRLTRAD
ncbi:hypothetical protein [Rhizobium leucaenae]|uniref:hypothetical protein n=1 Tax=Rhizobium leucaenae TaxID=29450 RepID=UPI0016083563|nr:hypothetical protein [Rhizobium leucaenae]MBB6301675.1 hypothetical protein [Rhizobium leucaenae]